MAEYEDAELPPPPHEHLRNTVHVCLLPLKQSVGWEKGFSITKTKERSTWSWIGREEK